ncbi:MAG: leucine-rich repeat protein [Clostridia bacterium]|nr:leucine-rich repeat protein [Clostridia bacterium]
MKTGKRILSILLSLMLALGTVAAGSTCAFAETYGDFEFNYGTFGYAITGYNGPGGNVEIPSFIDGVSIKEIYQEAFSHNETITSIVIPDTVSMIWENAFSSCSNLETVTIGTVDDEEDNPGLEVVQRCAFNGCDSLTAVYYTGSLAQWARIEFSGSTDGTNPVEMSHKLFIRGEEPVHITAVDLAGVEKIGEAAFRSIDSLESAEIPEGLKTIRLYAFYDCKNLKTVSIPLSVSLIENNAFAGCTSLTDVYYAGSAEDWSKIEIYYENECLTDANIHYAVSFDETEVSVEKDGTLQLTATLNPGYSADDIIWTSSDPEIASVSSGGLVTGKGLGTVTVTAKLGESGPSATCTVTVVNCLHSNTTQVPAKAATCTEDGNNEYTHCNDCGEDIGRTDTPALGHNYENVEYSSDDTQHWQVCSRCNEDSAKDNHTFGAATYTWSADNSICTAKHTCTVCGKEVSETVDSTSQETPAACFTDGKIQYTATFTKPGFTIQTTEAPSGESAGHDWGAPSYVWSADNSTCTATRVCTRNADHKEEETVNAAVTTTATCTEAGVTTYASSFDNPAFEAQEKTVAVDALGHNREESIAKEATEDSLGIIEDRCTRCGDTDNTRLYLLDNTSPSKYPDGSYISENVVSSADNGTLGSDGIQMVLQDPLGAFDDYFITYSAELIGVSADPGDDYDNAFEIENACRALVGVTINGTYIVGTFPEKARLLLQIPDGWDVDDIAALRINSGVDTYYVTAVEYRLYDAEGEFVKVVTADYEPAEGETVRAFAAFWTDYFYNSPYAIIDIYTDKDALDEYKDEAKNAIDALAQNGDSDEVREIIDNAKDAVDALGYDESKSLEENKAAVDALVDSAADDVADQREADKLAADKEAFDEYKDEAKNAIDALAQDGDSDEVREIIDNAKDEIDALGYDESKSLEENKAAVDALVDSAAGDIEDQRETEQTPVSVEIKDFTEETETGYKEDKTFTASAENLPEGAEIHWFVNGEDVGTGESYTVEDPTDDYTVQAKVLDKDGNVVKESAVHKVKVKNGFFDRLIAFILNLIEKILGKAIADFLSSVC